MPAIAAQAVAAPVKADDGRNPHLWRPRVRSVDIVGSGPGEIVEFDGHDVDKTDQAKRTRLQACLGLNIELFYKKSAGDEADLSAAGKLVSIGPKFVILQAKTNNFAVPLGQITRMKTPELPIRVHVPSR